MLSGETARGDVPDRSGAHDGRDRARSRSRISALGVARPPPRDAEPTIATSIAEAATRASTELDIPFIVTGTTTGNTAHHIAAFRPQARIIALTPDPQVARRLALLWGTESLLIDQYASFDVLIYMTEREMVHAGLVNSGDLIAFTTGMPVGAGGTNVLKIHQIP